MTVGHYLRKGSLNNRLTKMPFVPLLGWHGGWGIGFVYKRCRGGGWVNLAKVCGDILVWCSHQRGTCRSHLEVAEKTNGYKFPFGFLRKLMAKDWFGG